MLKPLFPEIIPVSNAEVNAWLDTIPNLSSLESRRQTYRKNYNVDNKIRTAKLAQKMS
jgi:hypothetical protein